MIVQVPARAYLASDKAGQGMACVRADWTLPPVPGGTRYLDPYLVASSTLHALLLPYLGSSVYIYSTTPFSVHVLRYQPYRYSFLLQTVDVELPTTLMNDYYTT